MSRIIVDNQSKLPDEVVVGHISKVIEGGKVSENAKGVPHYCWATQFPPSMGSCMVYARHKKKGQTSDSFLVTDLRSVDDEE